MATQETKEGGSGMNKDGSQKTSYTRTFRNETRREKGDGRKFDKGDRFDRADRTDKRERTERFDKSEHFDKGDRQGQTQRTDRQGRYQRTEGSQDGKPRYNRNEGGRVNKPDHYDKNKGYNSQPRFPNKDEDDEDEIIYASDANETVLGSSEEVLDAGFVIDEDSPEDIMDVFGDADADTDTYED